MSRPSPCRRHAPPRSLVLTQPQPPSSSERREWLERRLARRPLTVGDVWAITDQLDQQEQTR